MAQFPLIFFRSLSIDTNVEEKKPFLLMETARAYCNVSYASD